MLGVVALLLCWFWADTVAAEPSQDGELLDIADVAVDVELPVDLPGTVEQVLNSRDDAVPPVVHEAVEATVESVEAVAPIAPVAGPAVTEVVQPAVDTVLTAEAPPLPPVVPTSTPDDGGSPQAVLVETATATTIVTAIEAPAATATPPAVELATTPESSRRATATTPAVAPSTRSVWARHVTAMLDATAWHGEDAVPLPTAPLLPAAAPVPIGGRPFPGTPAMPPSGSGSGGGLDLPDRGFVFSILAAAAALAAADLATRIRALEIVPVGVTASRPPFTPD